VKLRIDYFHFLCLFSLLRLALNHLRRRIQMGQEEQKEKKKMKGFKYLLLTASPAVDVLPQQRQF